MTIRIQETMIRDSHFTAVARLRYRVYAEEEGHEMPGMDHDARTLVDPLDSVSHILAAVDDDEVVGTICTTPVSALPGDHPLRPRIEAFSAAVPESRQLLVGRLMVDADYRGGAACPQLFATAYGKALELGFEVALAECSPRNVPLYESVGCRHFGRPYVDSKFGLTVLLALLVRDLGHLNRVQSPLVALAGSAEPNEALGKWFEQAFGTSNAPLSLRLQPHSVRDELLSRATALPHSPFAAITSAEQARAMRSCTTFGFDAGAALIQADCACTETFLIVEGEVEVTDTDPPTGEPRCRRLASGQVLNEQSLLDGRQRPVRISARAVRPTRVLVLGAESFAALRRGQPALAASIEQGLRHLATLRDASTPPRARPARSRPDLEELAHPLVGTTGQRAPIECTTAGARS